MTRIRTLMGCLFLAALFTVGCAGTKSLGKVGDTTYYAVRARSVFNPSVTLIVSQKCENSPQVEASAGGQGIGQTFVTAAGNVGASAAFGLSLRPDRTKVTNTAGSDSNAASEAAASGTGSSSATGGPVTRVNGNSANAPGHNK